MQYTVLALIYGNGSVQYIAIGPTGQPLDPQPDLTNAVPCPDEETGGGGGAGACCPDYSTGANQVLQTAQLQNINTTLGNLQSTNTSILNAVLNLTGAGAQQTYRTLHGIVGNGGTLGNSFTIPANAISVCIIPLAAHPTTLNAFTPAQLLGNTVTDDGGTTLTLAVLKEWKQERRQLANGAYQPIGGNITVSANSGGAVFIIYETI